MRKEVWTASVSATPFSAKAVEAMTQEVDLASRQTHAVCKGYSCATAPDFTHGCGVTGFAIFARTFQGTGA